MDEVGELKDQLKVKMDSENQMREVVAEYERTISELISDKEKEKSEMEVMILCCWMFSNSFLCREMLAG